LLHFIYFLLVRFKEILRYAGHNLTSITIFEFKTIKLLYLIGFIKSRHFMDYKREADKFGFIWIISAIILSILEPIYIGYESVFDNNGYNSGNHFGALRGFMLCARFRA